MKPALGSFVTAVAVACAPVVGCSAVSEAPADLTAITDANTAFALDLYQREKGKVPNLFFSPYSISSALAMTWAGARGETEQQMAQTLHFGQPPAQTHEAFGKLTERLAQIERNKDVSLSIANSLWCQQSYRFSEEFLKINQEHYRAETRRVNFQANAEAARVEINDWVERKTQDKIQDLLQPGQIGDDTRLVLCNAIYFKGNWVAQFDPKATRPLPFFVGADQSVTVPMMSRSLQARMHQMDDLSLLTLPYTGGDVSMVIVLPKAVDGLAALEERLSASTLREWLSALDAAQETEVAVTLPKFTLNCRLDLARDLAAMGMPSAFGSGADFSGMTGSKDLFISDVVHQAFVDVNEEGTEAAAATAVTMRLTGIRMTPFFRADHPFLFLIRDRPTGTILFLGRLTDPAGG